MSPNFLSKKNIISVIGIPVLGFLLLNFAFMLAAGIRMLIYVGFNGLKLPGANWMPPFFHLITAVILIGLALFAAKTKRLPEWIRAAFMMVALAITLVYCGLFLYNWPLLVYAFGAVIVLLTWVYFFKTKKPWMYYYGAVLVSAVLLWMQIKGVNI